MDIQLSQNVLLQSLQKRTADFSSHPSQRFLQKFLSISNRWGCIVFEDRVALPKEQRGQEI